MPFNFSPLWNRFCLWPSITFYQAASVITHAFKVPFTAVDEVGPEAGSLLSPISSHRRGANITVHSLIDMWQKMTCRFELIFSGGSFWQQERVLHLSNWMSAVSAVNGHTIWCSVGHSNHDGLSMFPPNHWGKMTFYWSLYNSFPVKYLYEMWWKCSISSY